MEEVLNNSNFDGFIKDNETVLVDFYADWCGPCMMMGPIIEKFAKEHQDIKVGTVNIDEEMELASNNRVVSIPTLILFKNGELVKRNIGALSKAELEQFVADN